MKQRGTRGALAAVAAWILFAGGLSIAVLFSGCSHSGADSAPPVESLWQALAVVADGNGEDWTQVPPLYYDSGSRTSIWAVNDDQRLCLLIIVGNEETARRLERSGAALSLETGEEGAAPFGLKLKGVGPGNGPPQDKAVPEKIPQKKHSPGLKARHPKKIIVSYPYASDEMSMTPEEAAGNGIELGLGNPGSGPWVFEAVIRLDAVYFKTPVPDGSRVTLSLVCQESLRGDSGPDGSQGPASGRGGGRPPAGGPPGGGGGHGEGKPEGGHEKMTRFNPGVTLILSTGPSEPKTL